MRPAQDTPDAAGPGHEPLDALLDATQDRPLDRPVTGPQDRSLDGPLSGLRVLVPRAPERAGALMGALRRAGAEPVAAPLVLIEPPQDPAALDGALASVGRGEYAWVAVTSGFTVDSLEATAARAGRTLADVVAAGRSARPGSTRVAAVGDATAAALRRAGVEVDFVPAGEQSARGMLAEWPGTPGSSSPPVGSSAPVTVLLPQGDLAEPTLAEGLAAQGWRPQVVVSYRNRPAAPLAPDVVGDLESGRIGAVVLTSGSTARRLADQATLPSSTLVCCIGPRTAEVAASLGLRHDLVADTPHPRAVVDALTAALTRADGSPTHPTGR
jgi:uroporphyrinogen-III synthase